MSALSRQKNVPPPPLNWMERWQRRTRNNIRQIIARGDITTLIVLWSMLSLPVLGLHAADWANGMLALLPIVFFSVLFGYLLGWSRMSEPLALIVSSLYGFLLTVFILIVFVANGGTPAARISDFINRLTNWSSSISAGTSGEDNLVFVLFMAILFWFLGYSTAWHVFRIDRVWRAVLPPGIVLLINNFYYLGSAPVEAYLILYIFLAMLLVVRSHVDAREYEWYRNRVRYSRDVRKYFLRVGAIMAIIIVLFAWLLPTGQDGDNMDRFQDFLSRLSKLGETWDRLFSSLESQGIASSEYYGGDKLELSGAIQLGDRPVLEIEAPPAPGTRYYWRSTVFDTYLNRTWEQNRSVRATKEGEGLELNIGESVPGSRRNVTQNFTLLIPASSLVYGAPQPIGFGLPVKVELDCVTDPTSFDCVNRNQEVDASVIRSIDTIREGDEYTVTSSMSVATADQLRGAATDYPGWVTQKYLQYGTQISPRMRDLTLQIIAQAGAVTPYDKAKAIERWLRANIVYDEAIPTPPADMDPVEWVLFEYKRGYCNYYASAMIFMLRSEGIPARMAAGFSQGSFNPGSNSFTVKERDAHTWVEVYFPGYGWVEFEPTADEDPLDREGDTLPDQPQQTATPLPSSTPTIPPTNTPNAPTLTPTPPTNQQQPILPTATPTFTPAPTMPPSPTPPPPPQETQVPTEEDSNLLQIILIFLGILLALVTALALAVVFTIWWVEHRGLGGLTMVEKAYARLAIYGNWLGIRLPPQHTPEERRRVLVSGVPDGENPISDITELYIERRFAPPNRQPEQDEKAILSWSEARMAFIRRKIQQWLGRA